MSSGLAAPVVPSTATPPATEAPIVDPGRVWALSPEEKLVEHPIVFEGRVSYFERRWRHLWLERNGVGEYVPLSAAPPELRQGQHVRIEGKLLPKTGLEAARVRVQVLDENVPASPADATATIYDHDRWWCRVVRVTGYVDDQLLMDDDHLRLSLIVGGQPVTAWVKPGDPHVLPQWTGRFVQFTGLYQARFDPTATQMTIELWTGRQSDVVVSDGVAVERRFDRPVTPIREIFRAPAGAEIKIRGRLRQSTRGTSLVVRDETGEVLAFSPLQERLPLGTEVELVGTPDLIAARWTLRAAFFRILGPPAADEKQELTSIEQIRQLSPEQAARGVPVAFAAVVTWGYANNDFFFVQDLSAGIRVHFKRELMDAPMRNKYLFIEGVTYNGGFAPAVELRRVRDLGAMETPRVKEISYSQAFSGTEDGQLVEMRGFFQRTDSDGTLRRIHLVTPTGEFIGLLDSAVNFSPNVGSLVRLRGACEVQADENGHITGVLLRVGSRASATIEADAPADVFDLPLRSIHSLRQLNNTGELMRVRVQGVVLHAVPGRAVYLEQEGTAMLLLTRERLAFVPGDVIEAVGILGREGVRTELREVVSRKINSGPAPVPITVADPGRLVNALDSRLVRLRGTLIDLVTTDERTRLTLLSGSDLFEAVLDAAPDHTVVDSLRLGAGLELTGIYRLAFDDSRRSRRFQLQLRSPLDIAVFRAPRLWTLQRALTAAAVLSGCTLLGLAWVLALRRRVHRQTAQIRAQLEQQARLEVELQRAARLESLGVLAGGIAHDFNNVLTAIMGNLGLALAEAKLPPAVAAHLQEIARAANRARRLTRQLLTFAKGGDPLLAAVALPAVVREAFDLTAKEPTVKVELVAPAELWPVSADKDQLQQALQNLALNAIQAMPGGGLLRAVLANETIVSPAGRGLAPGRYVKLSLSDTGEGIPAEALPKIFDPYFSTREAGSGLGLATVYSIITKHQGRIEVESVVGQGTTFHLWLPAAAAPALASGSESPFPMLPVPPVANSSTEPGRRQRILFMDDEESIRLVGAIALRRGGYDVVAVADGDAALREFEAARAEQRAFDLLILDLTIPAGLGGRETIERIRKLDPRVPAIVSSGYSSDPVMANFTSYGFQATVPKPYEIGVLMAAIEKALSR